MVQTTLENSMETFVQASKAAEMENGEKLWELEKVKPNPNHLSLDCESQHETDAPFER